ncbi:MAG: DUF4258 domain-containing protein [Hyphomicrobiales bacterium]|nr:DUF4258 domain-containing protein [Hyphomicrobiales bacterium]
MLLRDEALAVIRELAADSSRIVVVGHARKRGRERSISRRQIERCCQKGTIIEGPFRNAHGHWQVSLFRHAAGEEITCAVAIEWRERLIVITAF